MKTESALLVDAEIVKGGAVRAFGPQTGLAGCLCIVVPGGEEAAVAEENLDLRSTKTHLDDVPLAGADIFRHSVADALAAGGGEYFGDAVLYVLQYDVLLIGAEA